MLTQRQPGSLRFEVVRPGGAVALRSRSRTACGRWNARWLACRFIDFSALRRTAAAGSTPATTSKFSGTASFTDVMLLFTLREYGARLSGAGALASEARFGTDWLLRT